MNRLFRASKGSVGAVLCFVLTACVPAAPSPTPLSITPTFSVTPSPTPAPTPIYLNLVWLLHQPLQAIDPGTGLIERSVTRISALHTYLALMRAAEQHPTIHTTLIVTPILARQLSEIASGARDQMWESTIRAPDSLTPMERNLLIREFGQNGSALRTSNEIVAGSVRYGELLGKLAEGAGFSEQDILDTQVWHHLALLPASRLREAPLDSLVRKDRNFTEEDKRITLEQVTRFLQEILPAFKALQDRGVIDIITAPFAYPILPLLMDTAVQQSIPGTPQTQRPVYGHPNDGAEQLARAIALHERLFGRKPSGLWPSAGAISPAVLSAIQEAGFSWLVVGERALAGQIGESTLAPLARDANGVPLQAEALYQAYAPAGQPNLTLVFGDSELSEAVRRESHSAPDQAAQRLIDGVLAIRQRLSGDATRTHLATVVLDVAGMSEPFFQALFNRLAAAAEAGLIQTVHVPEYMSRASARPELTTLTPATWNRSYEEWAGSVEDITAWNLLNQAREFLQSYLVGNRVTEPAAVSRAYEALLLAQSADWFEAYGGNLPASERAYADAMFRGLLAQVYREVDAPAPDYVKTTALQPSVVNTIQPPKGPIAPTLNGIAEEEEWDKAGLLTADRTLSAGTVISAVRFGLNPQHLFFLVETTADIGALIYSPNGTSELRLGVYLRVPAAPTVSRFTRVSGENEARQPLGFDASHLVEWVLSPDGSAWSTLYEANANLGWTAVSPVQSAARGSAIELMIPIESLGELRPGDTISFAGMAGLGQQMMSRIPDTGIAQIRFTELSPPEDSVSAFTLQVSDPAGDDYGFGRYTYPTDAVFTRGAFDLKQLRITQENGELVFRIELFSPISNPWNSPIGLSLQTFDIYIDRDPGQGTGRRKLLEGRNASLPKNYGWEIALWIEGWRQQVLKAVDENTITSSDVAAPTVTVDPLGTLTVRVAVEALGGGNPADWAYAVVVLSQDAFPARGVRRVRDIAPVASQWRLGGAPADTNHTRIIDLFTPANSALTQEAGLGAYPPHSADPATLDADQFGTVPVLTLPVE
ncbi:MAG: glucodextranase DOMON-like domain-containing protein [Anaerolineae bacterium]|nr:hypothetical protein [Thermoflexales bacterium]MDW8408353.1 glucodextranase DOMON-like domain-containing protein [Anaerolineae bacterium]